MTKKVRVDVFDGDKKIANFEGDINLDDWKRIGGRAEEDKSLTEKIEDVQWYQETGTYERNSGNKSLLLSQATKIAQIADAHYAAYYKGLFDEAWIEYCKKDMDVGKIKYMRKAMFENSS